MPGLRPEILILGIGNILMSDDGIGVRVVERLREIPLPESVELVDGGTSGADLVDILADRKKAIIVDAVDVGAAPGTILRFDGDTWSEKGGQTLSLHEVGLSQTLSMVRILNAAPRELVIFGVQIRTLDHSLEMSKPVSEAIGPLVRLVLAELES
jgi:hydrogenase maturation protease